MPQIITEPNGYQTRSNAKHGRDARSALCQRMLLATASVCALLSGCHNVATIWSTEVRSPDGRWIAVARTDQYGGPGNAGLQTIVSLKRTGGPKDTIEILVLTQNTKSIDLKMNWLMPSQLEVIYNQPVIIDFQAVKCGGVDISLRQLPNKTSNAGSH